MSSDTTKRVTVPIARPHHAEQRVLLVDDEINVLNSIGAYLARAGFEVQKTTSSDEALRAIAGDPAIEVMVTDFAMPGMSGAELILQAVQIRPSLKALIMTGYPNSDELAKIPPDVPILAKPFHRAELIAGVNSLIDEMPAALN